MRRPFLALLFLFSLGTALRGAIAQQLCHSEKPEVLKLLISLEQPSITSPFPARITLHLHNSGQEPLWLYRPVRSQAQEGPSLALRLEPLADLGSHGTSTPAQGGVLESAGLPHPRLVRLDPGHDHEEKAVVQLSPVLVNVKGESKPLWGRYRLSVTYSVRFSNGDEIARNLALAVWQGDATSNAIEIELVPPAGQGSVGGKVAGPDGRPRGDVLVSLSDDQERLVDQQVVGPDGRYSFSRLPFGFYWVTARPPNPREDTAVFRHVELTSAEPTSAIGLMMLSKEIYEAKGMLHKPVLFRVTDRTGRPLDKVRLEITWSNGPVLDNVKGQASDDGALALELIPGRNFVTLKRRGCPKQDERVDVTEGWGIDGFKLSLECARN